VVLDKENAAARRGIFMIDASKGFRKDGAKNRLREQDIHRVVDVPGYARMVPHDEVADPKNAYNLNLPRYIASSDAEDTARALSLALLFTPVRSPESNGMSERASGKRSSAARHLARRRNDPCQAARLDRGLLRGSSALGPEVPIPSAVHPP